MPMVLQSWVLFAIVGATTMVGSTSIIARFKVYRLLVFKEILGINGN